MKDAIAKLYARYGTAATSLRSLFLLAVRLYWGWQFAQTGWGKFHRLPQVIEFFTSLGIPAPAVNAYFVSGLELVGGILLALGLGGRIIALPLAFDMLVAYATADREALGSIFSDPGKFYAAAPFTFLMASLMVLVFGSGLFAIDALLARFWRIKASNYEEPISLSAKPVGPHRAPANRCPKKLAGHLRCS
jgi:putative oxidoreductase